LVRKQTLIFKLTRRYNNIMTKGKRGQQTRMRLLDAAEEIVGRQGVLGLTFDRVAEQAGVAKGTVLYHFDSKEALTAAMIERFVERFDTAWADSIRLDPVDTAWAHSTRLDPYRGGRSIGAYSAAPHRGEPLTGRHFDDVNGAITAALANSPERLEAVRAQGQRHQEAIESDALDPVLSTIIRMAIDGLWFAESFSLMHYDQALKAAVLDRLTKWTRGEATTVETLGCESASADARQAINGRTKR
jgi:AcrR family transcriptional regulator